jgi:hypothetical protein
VAPALSLRAVRPEVRMLAAIRTWALDRRPRLTRVLPGSAPAGAPVLLVGQGFGEGVLEARFGGSSTWAVALGDGLAVALVPPGAGSPLVLFRRALASNPLAFQPSDSDGPTRVVRVDPGDGVLSVLCDSPVVVRFSRPLDVTSLREARVEVGDRAGALPGRSRLSPDAQVLIWLGSRQFQPQAGHSVRLEGLRDQRGEPVAEWESVFATGRLTRDDLS